VGIAFAKLADGNDIDPDRMAVNRTAIGDDHVTRSSRSPNWTICAPSRTHPTFDAHHAYSATRAESSQKRGHTLSLVLIGASAQEIRSLRSRLIG